MEPTSPLDRRRLRHVVALFDSPQDGEKLAALAAAGRLLAAANTSWPELIEGLAPPAPDFKTCEQAESPSASRDHHAIIAELARGELEPLTAWELDFISSARAFRRLSPKQWGILDQIVAKVAACEASL